jgi:hypothetical protein
VSGKRNTEAETLTGYCRNSEHIEHRTSNIERPTSNEKTNIKYRTFNGYFFFFPAVFQSSGWADPPPAEHLTPPSVLKPDT